MCEKPFRPHACIYTSDICTRARWKRPVRACTRGCVGACNAREMRRTTIQILLLLLREQSPVNRPPRHNVSIQVRSAVLNRSGSTLCESRKKPRVTDEDCQMRIAKLSVPRFIQPKILTTHEWDTLFFSFLPSEEGRDTAWLAYFYFIWYKIYLTLFWEAKWNCQINLNYIKRWLVYWLVAKIIFTILAMYIYFLVCICVTYCVYNNHL